MSGGQVQLTGGHAAIGTAAAKIAQADIVGGCTVNGNAKICSNSAQSKVYANSYISTPQSLTKPPVDAAGTYAGGDWNHPGLQHGILHVRRQRDARFQRRLDHLLTGSAYNCTVYKTTSHVAGNEMGTLSWNPATKALAVSGTLYLDGDLVMSGGNANLHGNGDDLRQRPGRDLRKHDRLRAGCRRRVARPAPASGTRRSARSRSWP